MRRPWAALLLSVLLAACGDRESPPQDDRTQQNLALSPGAIADDRDAAELKCGYPFYAPPAIAKTVDDIRLSVSLQLADGTLDVLNPEKRRFEYRDSQYLVAIDNNILGAGGEAYTHAWFYIYNQYSQDWRCFQHSHFRGAYRIDAELLESDGTLIIKSVGNDSGKGEILTVFNLEFTSDDSAFLR